MSAHKGKLFEYNIPWNTSGSRFEALDTNPMEWAQYAREWLENAYNTFPDRTEDLVKRFRKKDRSQHQGAYFELLIHELMLRSGGEIQIHPSGLGGAKNPDFLVESNGESFILEAKTVMPKRPEDKYYYTDSEEDVFRKLRSLASNKFFFRVKFSGFLNRHLAKRQIEDKIRPLLEWGTDHFDGLRAAFQLNLKRFSSQQFQAEEYYFDSNIKIPPHGNNMAFIEDNGWKLSVSLIPVVGGSKNLSLDHSFFPEPERVIDVPHDWLGRGHLDRGISEKLSEFAKEYQGFSLPTILAVHFIGDSPIRPHNWIPHLMLGSNYVSDYPTSDQDGWFRRVEDKRRIPFAAVWFFLGLSPALMLNTRHQVFINPSEMGQEFPDFLNRFTGSKLNCNDEPHDLGCLLGWDLSIHMGNDYGLLPNKKHSRGSPDLK